MSARAWRRACGRVGALAAALALVLASGGCGDDADDSAGSTDTTIATTAETTLAVATETTPAAVTETTPAAVTETTLATTTETTGAAGVAETTVGPAPSTGRGVLVDLQAGDRACYVVVRDGQNERSIEGAFELCPGDTKDASALVGSPVEYRTERARVQAASCEGNPDCTDSDDVELVVEITAAGPTEAVGDLRLGLDEAAVAARLGAPATKSERVEQAATGEFVSTWAWPDRGVSLDMAAESATGPSVVGSINVTAPSTLATPAGIAVGSTSDDVRRAYAGFVNEEESSESSIVIGSVFGGMIFQIDGGRVSRIFVGAAAE